jgi:P-type Cu2+ transporter
MDVPRNRSDFVLRLVAEPDTAVAEVALRDCFCATEMDGVERALRRLPGVLGVQVDRTRAVADVRYDRARTDAQALRGQVAQLGYRCDCVDCPDSSCQPGHPAVGGADIRTADHGPDQRGAGQNTVSTHDTHEPDQHHGGMDMGMSAGMHGGHGAAMVADMFRRFIVCAVLTVPIVLFSPVGASVGFTVDPPVGLSTAWFGLILTTPVVFWGGRPFLSGAWRAARYGEANMMTLITTGILVSYLYSVVATFLGGADTFFEAAAMLTTFSLAGHWLEMRSRFAAGRAVQALLAMAPSTARVRRAGDEVEIPLDQVTVGDQVVRPGDRVPVDGTIHNGESYVDESLITGESVPVAKHSSSQVTGGTVNTTGSFTFIATGVGADTALARIARLVENAQASKAPAQRLADTAGRYLTFVALGTGLVTFVAWLAFGGHGAVFAVTAAVSAVVIACPDALALATPTAITVGVSRAAGHGMLFKNATALETAARIDTVVFDKTGTLTQGRPAVTDIVPQATVDEDRLLGLAASADQKSQHPLAEAIVRAAAERAINLSTAEQFEVPGHGVVATVAGQQVLIGNAKLLARYHIPTDGQLSDAAAALVADGRTPVYVAEKGALAGVVAIANPVRESAVGAVQGLHAAGVTTVMLTGDQAGTAHAVARATGIDTVIADVPPRTKRSTSLVCSVKASGSR